MGTGRTLLAALSLAAAGVGIMLLIAIIQQWRHVAQDARLGLIASLAIGLVFAAIPGLRLPRTETPVEGITSDPEMAEAMADWNAETGAPIDPDDPWGRLIAGTMRLTDELRRDGRIIREHVEQVVEDVRAGQGQKP